jgi:hypothetical protein
MSEPGAMFARAFRRDFGGRVVRQTVIVGLVLGVVAATPLAGQTLRDRLSDLFRFGVTCATPDALLCISNASGQDAQFAFSASLESENERLIGFVGNAIGQSVANIPTPATSAGSAVEFTPGGRIETRLLSGGPIYAERAPSLGRGKLLVGVLFSQMTYRQLRGVPIGDLVFNFRHVDIPGTPGLGDPIQENNVLQVRMQLALQTTAASFFATYGITNTFDVGVAVPLVFTSLRGLSEAQIVPFGPNSVYSFGGPAEDPKVVDNSFQEASAVGIGDVGVRLKLNLKQGERYGYGVQGDLRLPTGSEDNFHGLGTVAARALGVVSAEFGRFTPHVNLGYLYRGRADSLQNHTVVGLFGFDHMLTEGVTLAVDLLSEFELDKSAVQVPPDIQYTEPFTRTVVASTIPDRRDNRLDATFGFKWSVPCTAQWPTFCARGADVGTGVTFITSVVLPLNNGGLRPGVIWSVGAQYKF